MLFNRPLNSLYQAKNFCPNTEPYSTLHLLQFCYLVFFVSLTVLKILYETLNKVFLIPKFPNSIYRLILNTVMLRLIIPLSGLVSPKCIKGVPPTPPFIDALNVLKSAYRSIFYIKFATILLLYNFFASITVLEVFH